jgi:hypothetical protein
MLLGIPAPPARFIREKVVEEVSCLLGNDAGIAETTPPTITDRYYSLFPNCGHAALFTILRE